MVYEFVTNVGVEISTCEITFPVVVKEVPVATPIFGVVRFGLTLVAYVVEALDCVK
jgi:hypothetical protein